MSIFVSSFSARCGALFILFALFALNEARAVDLGKPAPDFDLLNIKQESVKLSAYQGKVVYLDFWASWCGPCRQTFPWMNQMQAKYGKEGFEIVAVNIDKKRPDADKFLAQMGAEFTVVFDTKLNVARSYELKAAPTAFLIDREGNLVSTHLGFQADRAAELEASIVKLLGTSKNP